MSMKYITLFILAIISFAISRLILLLTNPNDPEGTNLLITSGLAMLIFAFLLLAYLFVLKKHKAEN